jgi:hypothetical protein
MSGKKKLLSMGGKDVLRKAVMQSIHVSGMTVFKIPNNICKGITNAILQLWWDNDDDNKRMHWILWWKMCVPKGRCGMGFRDRHTFNMEMLAKQCWRLLEKPDSTMR